MPQKSAKNLLEKWVEQGIDPKIVYYQEWLPVKKLSIQGEIVESEIYGTYHMVYSIITGLGMRDALKKPLYANGLAAIDALQRRMDPSSFDDLKDLFELYPKHVIEFLTFRCNVGIVPNRNTVIGEVRLY